MTDHYEIRLLQDRVSALERGATATPDEVLNNSMDKAAILQWIDACNYEPAREALRELLTLRLERPEMDAARRYAFSLATALAAKHYQDVPQWKPLPDLLGLLTQIDNMTAGLSKSPMGEGTVGEIRKEAAFLLDRLDDMDFEDDADDISRDFAGHVTPSIERLRLLLAPSRQGTGK